MSDERAIRPVSDPGTPAAAGVPHEELVAYLDGELSPVARQRIERLMADDPRVRIELARLEQTWELLDRLPQARLDPAFTRTTVEMVAVKTSGEIDDRGAVGRLRTVCLASAAIVSALLAGAWSGERYFSRANRRLVEELGVLEHFEAYRQAPDLKFLRALAGERLFNDPPSEAGAGGSAPDAGTAAVESRSARRLRMERMDSREKEQIVRKQKAMQELSPAEQERLRRLDAELAAAPDAAELDAVLGRFQHWLSQLPAAQRAHLQHAAGGEQRLQEIKQMRQTEAERLGPDDARRLADWWLDVFKQRPQGKAFARLSPEQQQERMRLMLLNPNTRLRRGGLQQMVGPADFVALRAKLSRSAVQLWEQAERQGPEAKRRLLRLWFQDAFHLRATGRPAAGGAEIADERLRTFFAELPDDQQAQLLERPPDEMFRLLRQRYETAQAK